MRCFPVILLFLFSIHNQLLAQDEESQVTWKVTTESGKTYKGTLIESSNTSVVLELKDGTLITLSRDKIVEMWNLETNDIEEYHPPANDLVNRPPQNQYRSLSSAYTLPKGHGYYENTNLFLNSVNYGLADNLEVEAGIAPLLFIIYPYWFKLKASTVIVANKITMGVEAGIAGAAVVYAPDQNSVGNFVTGKITYGTRHRNFTLGYLSVGTFEKDVDDVIDIISYSSSNQRLNLITLGGILDLSDSWSVFGESYIPLKATGIIINSGLRQRRNNVTWDFGFNLVGESDEVVLFPVVTLRVPFK